MGSASEDQTKLPQKLPPPPTEVANTQQYYGYPPQYPPYPPPYPGYPNHAYAAAPPPAAYYYSPQQYQSQSSARFSSIRFLAFLMMLLVFFSLALSLLAGSEIPDFYVQSLSVPSFNITNDILSATWDANITVKKHNDKLDIFFDRIEGIIFSYNDDNALGASQDQKFDMGTRNEAVFNMKLSTTGFKQHSGGGNFKEMVQEKGKAVVSFRLRMLARVTYKSGSFLAKHSKFRILCENLEVQFAGPTGPGNLVEGREEKHRCFIYGNRMYADEY